MIQIDISRHRKDLLITALEGGSNYWYFLDSPACKIAEEYTGGPDEDDEGLALSEGIWEAIKNGKTIPIHDAEDESEKLGEINLLTIEKGEQILADKYPFHLSSILTEDDDSITADVWFQLAVFGELVYG